MEIVKNRFRLELPAHIRDAISNIHAYGKEVDLIVNVYDSRAPQLTNLEEEIHDLFPKVKVLGIASKPDLSLAKCENAFNLKDFRNKNKILRLIKKSLEEEMSSFNRHGYKSHLQILVVGFPNVGKSTLINLLKSKKVSIVQDRPGVTKKIIKYYLGDNLWLYDSPGVFLYNRIENPEVDTLFLINAVPATIKDITPYTESAYRYLKKHYPNHLENLVGDCFFTYGEFIRGIARRFNFKLKEGK